MNKIYCPICEKELLGQKSEWPDYPFCSSRCRKIDLGRWLGERYKIPGNSSSNVLNTDEENLD